MPCSAVLGSKQYSTDAHPENHAGTFYYFIQNRNPGAEGWHSAQHAECPLSTAHTLLQHSQQSGSEHTTSYIAAAAGESWHCIHIYSDFSTFGPGWEWSCAWAHRAAASAVFMLLNTESGVRCAWWHPVLGAHIVYISVFCRCVVNQHANREGRALCEWNGRDYIDGTVIAGWWRERWVLIFTVIKLPAALLYRKVQM